MISEQQRQNADIVIVDDQLTNVMLLESILQAAGYRKLHSLTDPHQVIPLFKAIKPDLVLLDIVMPQLDGFQVMGQLKIMCAQPYLPVVVLTSQDDRATRLRALECGAKDFLNKPFDKAEVLMRIRNILEASLLYKELHHQKASLEETVKTRTRELQETQREIIQRLGRAAEFRDNETGAHIMRMSHYAAILAKGAGLSEQECELMFQAMAMHDIGKLGIPDRILLKPGPLDFEEWEIMKRHPVIGAELLSGSKFPLIQMAETIALTHHEKWDGTGYPNRLAGEDIPLPGRICAICDIFDALSSDRPYKISWPVEEALAEIRNLRGTHLDPHLVDVFEQVLPSILEVKKLYQDTPAPAFA